MKYRLCLLLSALSCFFIRSSAIASGDFGEMAPDFPAGVFSDGKQYHISDFRGKLLVLFFYEQRCPTCRATIPERNRTVKRFQGKPVTFIGVGAGDSPGEVQSYIAHTRLAMPVFADSRSAMEKAYGFRISLNNIYQVRVIGPDGRVIAYDMKPATIEEALKARSDDSSGEPETQASSSPEACAQQSAGACEPAAKTNTSGGTHSDLIRLHNEAVDDIQKKNCSAAIDKLKTILKKEPNYQLARENLQVAYTNHGVDLMNQGKLPDAEGALKQALELAKQLYQPNDEKVHQAMENYASVLYELGREKEADELLGKLPGGDSPSATPQPAPENRVSKP